MYGTCHKDLEQMSSILSVELIFLYILYILLFQIADYLMPWLLLVIKKILPISELYSLFRRTDLTTGDILVASVGYVIAAIFR